MEERTGKSVVTLLDPEGSSALVGISPAPAPFMTGMDVVPRLPLLGLASGSTAPFWAYDPTSSTLHPVDLAPPGTPLTAPVLMPDGRLVVVSPQLTTTTATAFVATSTDSGRTWTSRPLVAKDPQARSVVAAAAGPDGRLASVFVPSRDGSHWSDWTLPTSVPDVEAVLVADRGATEAGS